MQGRRRSRPGQIRVFRHVRWRELADIVRLIKEGHADLNWQHAYDGSTALIQALLGGDPALVEFLLECADVDVHVQEAMGYPASVWLQFPRRRSTRPWQRSRARTVVSGRFFPTVRTPIALPVLREIRFARGKAFQGEDAQRDLRHRLAQENQQIVADHLLLAQRRLAK